MVDLACHGTPPAKYFTQYIKVKKKQLGKNVTRCSFRDPKFGTEKFLFTLYDKDNLVYKKKVDEDLYCFGYHKALIYRECCYNCLYAKRDRCSDLTISDYSGLGSLSLYTGNRKSVSCILVNTTMGGKFLETIKGLVKYERPVEEPLKLERVFNSPYSRKAVVDIFKEEYSKCGDYEVCAKKAFSPLMDKANKKSSRLQVALINILWSMFPYRVKYFVKNLIK